jgi:HSP20 family protein
MTLVRFQPRWKTETDSATTKNCYNPALDILEGKDAFALSFDLPGFEKEDIKIAVNEGVLTVSGERKADEAGDENYFHYFERPCGNFSRSFRLPEYVNADAIKAAYKNGVLILELAKKEEAKPRTIEIK